LSARHIDVATRAVTLADGSVLPADAVLDRDRRAPASVSRR
jgi:hypothetical protein